LYDPTRGGNPGILSNRNHRQAESQSDYYLRCELMGSSILVMENTQTMGWILLTQFFLSLHLWSTLGLSPFTCNQQPSQTSLLLPTATTPLLDPGMQDCSQGSLASRTTVGSQSSLWTHGTVNSQQDKDPNSRSDPFDPVLKILGSFSLHSGPPQGLYHSHFIICNQQPSNFSPLQQTATAPLLNLGEVNCLKEL